MDAVAAAAGAGKMSAYRHFASKEDLVAAALERHNPRHVRWLVGVRQPAEPGRAAVADPASPDLALADPAPADMAHPGSAAADPVESILSAFDRLESAAGSEPFRGCPFVDAALAAPGTDHRPGQIAWRHKQQVTRELAALAGRAGLPEPGELGAAVALVIDGAAVQAALAPDAASRQQIVRRARRAAEVLLAVAARPAPAERPGPAGSGEPVGPGGQS
jgi:AcrR family transcriptional regulator